MISARNINHEIELLARKLKTPMMGGAFPTLTDEARQES
jgi:hypothetical protein